MTSNFLAGIKPSPQLARDALFQNLHHGRRRSGLGLGDEQMNMLGHHHIAHQQKLVLCADIIQDFQEEIAVTRARQQRTPLVAATRYEMKVVLSVAALEPVLQLDAPKHAPFANDAKDAAPAKARSKATRKSKARTLCKRRKGCGTRKGEFKGKPSWTPEGGNRKRGARVRSPLFGLGGWGSSPWPSSPRPWEFPGRCC